MTESGTSIAVFSDFGASCSNLSLLDTELIPSCGLANPADIVFGSVLAPWPNRLKGGHFELDGQSFRFSELDDMGNANHGLYFKTPWQLSGQTESTISFSQNMRHEQFPFDIDLEVRYELAQDHSFRTVATAINRGSAPAPFAIGFHPYFRIPEPTTLTASVSSHVITEAMIPVASEAIDNLTLRFPGNEGLDDCFFGSDWVLRLESAEFDLEISQQGLDYLMLYKHPESPFANGTVGLAIEPMSAPANAFQTEIAKHLLTAGESREFSFQVRKLN